MWSADALKREIEGKCDRKNIAPYWRFLGYRAHYDAPVVIAKAWGIKNIFEKYEKHIYENDLIAGSQSGLYQDSFDDAVLIKAREICAQFEFGNFSNNFDHFAPDYERFLLEGIPGVLQRIEESLQRHGNDPDRVSFLTAAKITMEGFSNLCTDYADAAEKAQKPAIAEACRNIAGDRPKNYTEALQLVWLTYQAFLCEDRYAMAFGRMDQYLYPFYKEDLKNGVLDYEGAVTLLESVFIKLYEFRHFKGADEVANICIGGVDREGADAGNDLSYAILEAVKRVRVPGPNLSARISKKTDAAFLIRCLETIGTGIGYPALMNDEINIPALVLAGHTLADSRNYCMVGCIENFIPGKEPPWSDGRYHAPKALEAVFNDGKCILSGQPVGVPCDLAEIRSMTDFLNAVRIQMEFLAAEYMAWFRAANMQISLQMRVQPFLSCFCNDCIERGLDVLAGGSVYPSIHGAVCMGIGTMADSLAAVESVVFQQKKHTLQEIGQALRADFKRYEALQKELLAAPKYGNNDVAADRYAVWY
ncbi:MAG: pyruvate formate lyase family protein, partial [Clostridia bacterium]